MAEFVQPETGADRTLYSALAKRGRAYLEPLSTANLGLVCITASEAIRYRTITRTHYLKFSEPERKMVLGNLYLFNLHELFGALEYCHASKIRLYRVTANLFPLSDLEDEIGKEVLAELAPLMTGFAARADALSIRATVHPGQFVVLSSESARVRDNSLTMLGHQAFLFDLLGLPRSSWAAINIHGGKGGRSKELEAAIQELPEGIKTRLTLENDEHAYSATEILEVCEATGIPMVFDAHHHVIHETLASLHDPSITEMTKLARQTWTPTEWQIVHLSNGRNGAKDSKHSDLIDYVPESYRTVDWIEVEAKLKEVAIQTLKGAQIKEARK